MTCSRRATGGRRPVRGRAAAACNFTTTDP